MEQKRNLDVDDFYKRMEFLRSHNADSGIFAFVVKYEGVDMCCFLMGHDAVYSQVLVDTFVLDKTWRSETNTPFFLRVAQNTAEQVARLLGVKKITYMVPVGLGELVLKHFADKRMKIKEWVVSYEMED